MPTDSRPQPIFRLPAKAAYAAGLAHGGWADGGGAETVTPNEAARRIRDGARPLVCHLKAVQGRLDVGPVVLPDILELFAFVRPARFCLPTPKGLAEAAGLALPGSLEAEAASLPRIAASLLGELAALDQRQAREAERVAWTLERAGWPWARSVLDALGADGTLPHSSALADGLRVWNRLPEWQDRAPEPPPDSFPVEAVEARARLKQLLGPKAEKRPEQAEYASAVAAAFAPRDKSGEPRMVLAEAGTGVGKTLGYIAPASVWAQKNHGAVWISTYTRNLQRQLDGELDRLYPDQRDKQRKVVVRKGRENYFCLLNFEDAVKRNPAGGMERGDAVALGLMARWALASRDGDMIGGDFPSWLEDLLGRRLTVDLTDTRGECVYAACPHYRRCFVERSIRRARVAEVVVANHALVLVQAALGGSGGDSEAAQLPTRYVFDEGHQLFDAADGAFSAHLSGHEAGELRRWLLGPEDRQRTRGRGLKARLEDMLALGADEEGAGTLADTLSVALHAARCLPAHGWRQRLTDGQPAGEAEAFLHKVRQQVLARQDRTDGPYSLEAATHPLVEGLLDAAHALDAALEKLARPLGRLVGQLFKRLDDETDELETATRQRIEGACRSLERRALTPLNAWRSMLRALDEETPPEFVDWFTIERIQGRDADLGLYRHWTDPMVPFAEMVAEPAHGVLVTSATLTDVDAAGGVDWTAAETRSGARHVGAPAVHVKVASPFDYPACTRVYVANDLNKADPALIAAAYRELFLASGGGGLGLFTAISRLREVHRRIAGPLEDRGLRLYAQHVDAMDTGTLIDVFRAEENSCLLGTDAVRDGIDVPGRSLRLIVFDRVPWPRPDILHKARRQAFGGRAYEEMLTRLKLKQAYGRLIRRAGDKGVFVMLDKAMPSRLATAFPDGVEVRRLGMRDILGEVRAFLAPPPDALSG